VSWTAVAALLFNATVWGASWWPFRQLQALGLHSLWATSLAMLIGIAGLALWRRESLGELLRRPGLWAVALAAGITNSCFNWAVSIGPVVRVVLLFYLMPVWSVLLARVLLREPLACGPLVRVGLALTGSAVVLGSPGVGLPLPASLADWLGMIGGMSFALTNVMLRRERSASTAARSMALFGSGAVAALVAMLVIHAGGPVRWPARGDEAVALALLAQPQGTALLAVPGLPGPVWLPAALGWAALLLAASGALQYGASRLPASVTAVVMLFEIVVATTTSVWLGTEVLEPRALVGGALILSSTLWSALAAAHAPVPRSE
jgi:drug/metabolite transporter (DMT)-like permease